MDFLKKKNKIIYTALISYILLYFILIIRCLYGFTSLINAVFILTVAICSKILYDFKKSDLTNIDKKIVKLVFFSIVIYFTVIYILGLFTGYGRSVYSISFVNIIRNTFLPLVSIISLEIFRYIYLCNNKEKSRIRFITFLIIMFDIILYFYIFDLTMSNIFIFITVTIIPLVFKNIMLTYISSKVGYYPCLVYVIPLCIYNYVIIYKPNLGYYLSSVLSIILPALIYINSSRIITNELKNEKSINYKKVFRTIIIDIPLLLLFTISIGLISGYFKYHIVGVQSSAIKSINRGDAIMIERGRLYEDYKKGDIIAYKNGKKIIIDKITKKTKDEYGYIKLYITKVINKGGKNKYKEIDEDALLGKYVDFKINKIAKPTVWFKEHVTNIN